MPEDVDDLLYDLLDVRVAAGNFYDIKSKYEEAPEGSEEKAALYAQLQESLATTTELVRQLNAEAYVRAAHRNFHAFTARLPEDIADCDTLSELTDCISSRLFNFYMWCPDRVLGVIEQILNKAAEVASNPDDTTPLGRDNVEILTACISHMAVLDGPPEERVPILPPFESPPYCKNFHQGIHTMMRLYRRESVRKTLERRRPLVLAFAAVTHPKLGARSQGNLLSHELVAKIGLMAISPPAPGPEPPQQ